MKVYLTFMGVRIWKIYEDNTKRSSFGQNVTKEKRPVWSQYGSTRKIHRPGVIRVNR